MTQCSVQNYRIINNISFKTTIVSSLIGRRLDRLWASNVLLYVYGCLYILDHVIPTCMVIS